MKGFKERKMKSRKILSLSAHFDLHPVLLRYHFLLFNGQIPPTILDIIKYTCTLTAPQKQLLSEVCKVMKLILAMTATNATSERTFSAYVGLKAIYEAK